MIIYNTYGKYQQLLSESIECTIPVTSKRVKVSQSLHSAVLRRLLLRSRCTYSTSNKRQSYFDHYYFFFLIIFEYSS